MKKNRSNKFIKLADLRTTRDWISWTVDNYFLDSNLADYMVASKVGLQTEIDNEKESK